MAKQAATARRWKERAKRAEKKLLLAEMKITDLVAEAVRLEWRLAEGDMGALRLEVADLRDMLSKEIGTGYRLEGRIKALTRKNGKLRARLKGVLSPLEVFAGLIRVADAIGPGMAWEEISKRECGE